MAQSKYTIQTVEFQIITENSWEEKRIENSEELNMTAD